MNTSPRTAIVEAPSAQQGIALVAVLILLGVLLTILGPFMMSMGQAGQDAYEEANEREADLLIDAARRTLVQRIADSQGRHDSTPGFDGFDEFPPRLELGEEGVKPLGNRRQVSGEIVDLQGRIHAPTAPVEVWSQLFGLAATLSTDLDKDEEDEIAASGISKFPESGFLWVDQELIQYSKKSATGFEGLRRAVDWPGGGAAPDPYGPAVTHRRGTRIVDARIRLLATAQFDEGHEDRTRFFPWKRLEDLRSISRFKRGELDGERLEELRHLVTFDAARITGGSLSKAERVFNGLVSGETAVLTVRDPASLITGSIVRIRVGENYEWNLVVGVTRRGGRRTTIAGPVWNVLLHRTTQLEAGEGEAFVETLLPVPINVNTAPREVLTTIMTGVRQRIGAAGSGVHSPLRTPLARRTARELADRIVRMRGGDVELEDEEATAPDTRPFECFEDFASRVLFPAVNPDGVLKQQELFYLYAALLHGSQTKLDQATIPVVFESAGLVRYRVSAAVQSGIGSTLAARERVGIAFPQPERAVDRFMTSQNDFDEATRTTRSRSYWQTGPRNTTVRVDPHNEPPDLSTAHLFSYLHGRAARFPDRQVDTGNARLSVARAPRFVATSATHGFETADHPEGRDIRREGPYEGVQAMLAANAKTGQGRQRQMRDQTRARAIPMFSGEQGLGITFGTSFWIRPETLGNQMLFDLSNRDRTSFRNRVFCSLEGNELVLRMFDVAGLDPNPGLSNPTETAVQWRVPVAGNGIAAQLWTHVGLEVCGGGPDGVVLFTDGAAKGSPRFLSYLGNEVPEWRVNNETVRRDRARSPPILLEDTEGWPTQGAIIVGEEVIDYVDITANTLITARQDSRGGRRSRQDNREFRQQNGGNNGGGNSGGGNNNQVPVITIPPHPQGSGVRLYGYSNSVAEDQVVIPGEGSLPNELAPWGVARVLEPLEPINFGRSQPGRGIDEDFRGDVILASPAVGAKQGEGIPGFDRNGGYALLMQIFISTGPGAFEPDELGGIEVVRYSGFDGRKITITDRAVQLEPDLKAGRQRLVAAQPRKFVTDWQRGTWQTRDDPNNLPQLWTFCVPISMSVGQLPLVDPSPRGHSEWVQINTEDLRANVEWARYDYFEQGTGWIVRSRREAVLGLHRTLTRNPRQILEVRRNGNRQVIVWGQIEGPVAYAKAPDNGVDEIGHTDPFELSADNLPHYEARLVFGFRGDAGVGTSTHLHRAGAVVTPVFRTFLGSVRDGRPSRGDRVAFVPGLTTEGSAPAAEWHTVTWATRNWEVFNNNNQGGGAGGGARGPGAGAGNQNGRDSRGPRANLVALEQGVTQGYFGRKLEGDKRFHDRILKFPSGELPMRLAPPVYGGSLAKDLPDFGGVLDDVQGYWGHAYDQRSWGHVSQIVGRVAVPCGANDGTINVLPSQAQIQGTGALRGGGLVVIEGEVVGVRSFDGGNGTLVVAANGRGMLGTEPRAHDVGARIQFLSSRPASALTQSVPATLNGVMVENPGRLPSDYGTVLVNRELMHYTWVRGPLLEMPQHPTRNLGLFRGRYGTAPARHESGSLAIHWPIRYWDRWDDLADDPEMSWLGFSVEAPNLYVTDVVWQEQIPDPLLDLKLFVRADARVPWTAEPGKFPLWRFDDPVDPQSPSGRRGRKILAQASRWDFRFAVDYKPGAFDPINFAATAWKRTPTLENFAWSYQAATTVLDERETLR